MHRKYDLWLAIQTGAAFWMPFFLSQSKNTRWTSATAIALICYWSCWTEFSKYFFEIHGCCFSFFLVDRVHDSRIDEKQQKVRHKTNCRYRAHEQCSQRATETARTSNGNEIVLPEVSSIVGVSPRAKCVRFRQVFVAFYMTSRRIKKHNTSIFWSKAKHFHSGAAEMRDTNKMQSSKDTIRYGRLTASNNDTTLGYCTLDNYQTVEIQINKAVMSIHRTPFVLIHS